MGGGRVGKCQRDDRRLHATEVDNGEELDLKFPSTVCCVDEGVHCAICVHGFDLSALLACCLDEGVQCAICVRTT